MSNTTVGKIYETTNYELFKYVIGNRPLKTKGVKYQELHDSIFRYGQLEPALVNRNYEVINGQHRLAVCKELGLPFKFCIIDDPKNCTSTAEIIADANNSKRWGADEFINYYSSQSYDNSTSYRLLKALCNEFMLPTSTIISIIASNEGGGAVTTNIRSGNFVLTEGEYNIVRQCLTDLINAKFLDWKKQYKGQSRPYWISVTYAWKHPLVDINRLISRMYEGGNTIPRSTHVNEYLAILSDVYNKYLGKKNKVYMGVDWEQGRYKEWLSTKQ